MRKNVSATMKQIYGTGNFNPRRFDRRPKAATYRLYIWGFAFFLFAIIAVILGGLYLFGRTPSSFTGERIDFELEGSKNPQTAVTEQYTLKITNNEDVALEEIELFIDFSAVSSASNNTALHFISSEIEPTSEANNTWELGELGVGDTKDFKFSARFVGVSGSELALPFSLTFRPTGFGSQFSVEHGEKFDLGDPTINVEIKGPSVVAKGSDVDFEILVAGASLQYDDLEMLTLSLDIPNAVSIESFDPELEDEAREKWFVSSLTEDNGEYKVVLSGTAGADASGEHSFVAELTRSGDKEPLVRTEKKITIQSADVGLDISVAPAQGKKLQWDERVDYDIKITNTGTYVMRNIVMRVALPEDALWKSDSLNIADSGFFESGSIFWDASTTDELDSIRPEKSVSLSFSLSTREKPPKGFTGKPELIAIGSVTAKLGDQDVTVESGDISINILADVEFDVSGWYKSPEGISWGEGPNPPQTGQKSTYAIIWKLGPTTSDLENLQITAVLPQNSSWENDTNYSVGEISYDNDERTATWKAGRIPKLDLPIEIRFMIGVTPTTEPSSTYALLERSRLIATDSAADEELEFFNNNITIGSIQ